MRTDDGPAWILLAVGAIAVVGLVLSASTFYGHTTFGGMMGGGGGMMGGTTTTSSAGPGTFEWAILVVSAAFFLGAVVLWYRSRASGRTPAAIANDAATPPSMTAVAAPPPPPGPAPAQPLGEVALFKLLDADERRMYLELRDHGGEMYQRDIVGLGVFSKAKVTRVLDKLETKGLVVREAHGMTNRVRLLSRTAK